MPPLQTVFNERTPVGLEGARVNSEEWNAVTSQAEGANTVRVAMPVKVGTVSSESVVPYDGTGRFKGLTMLDVNVIMEGDDKEFFPDAHNLATLTMGVIWATAGEAITAADADDVFYDPADAKYYTATDTGRVQVPGVVFDSDAAADELIALRIVRTV